MSFAMFTGMVAGALSLIAYTPRAIKIVRNKSHSSNTWLIWTLSNFLIFLSLYALGARTIIWVPLAYFLGSAAMTVLAYANKASGWTTLHKWLLGIALASAVRWIFFSDPLFAQIFNIGIYLASHIMIIRTKLASQNKESWVITWAFYFAGAILNLLAVTDWSPAVSAYPMIVFVMNGTVFSIALRKHLKNINEQKESITDVDADIDDNMIV